MKLDDLLLNIKAIGLNSIVCQNEIRTEKDKQELQKKGYQVFLTEAEFRARFKIETSCIWYSPSLSIACFYFNKETLAVCPFHIEMLMMSDKDTRFGVESYYEAIKRRELEVANNQFGGSILSLTDAMRIEYLKMLVEKKGVEISDLY